MFCDSAPPIFHDGRVVAQGAAGIVYREVEDPKNTAAALEASLQPDEQIEISPSTTLLQRYSAVTFNGHRIHYDRDYCLNEERYPGLLVQGPLQATFLLDLALKMNDAIAPRHFGFRATAPLFDEGAFTINGARGQHENSFWNCQSARAGHNDGGGIIERSFQRRCSSS